MLATLTTVHCPLSLARFRASLFSFANYCILATGVSPGLPLCPASFSVTKNQTVALCVLSLSRISLFSFASYSETALPTLSCYLSHVRSPHPDTGASPILSVLSPFLLQTTQAFITLRAFSFSIACLSFPLLAAQAAVHCPLSLLLRRGICFPLQTTPATCGLPALSFTMSRASLPLPATLATGARLPRQCWPIQSRCLSLFSFASYSDNCALPALLLALARLSFPLLTIQATGASSVLPFLCPKSFSVANSFSLIYCPLSLSIARLSLVLCSLLRQLFLC